MPMDGKELCITVNVTPEVFREFALFDIMSLKKRFVRPLVFAAIMVAFAVVCFALRGRAEQAGLLGTVLMIVGLGLPVFYFLAFFRSLQFQENQLSRRAGQVDYTVKLREDGIAVTDGKDHVELPWDGVMCAYRLRHSICLYVSANKAYLLPAADQAEANKWWDLISDKLPAEKREDRRPVNHR